jgi:predicted PurR-regulated permease PerM
MDNNIKKVILYILAAAAILAAAYFLYVLSDLVIILIVSILISFIFNPFINFIERWGINRLFSTLLVFISFFFLVYLVISFIIPKLLFQMDELLVSMKDYSLHDQIIRIEDSIHTMFPFFTPGEMTHKIETFLSGQLFNSFEFISPLLTSIVSIIALLVIIPFISFFILKDNNRIMQSLVSLLPNRYFEMSYWIVKRVSHQLGRYVRAWIFDASFVGITMGLGLYFLGIQYSLPLGVIAGLGHLIPYFGPVIGGVPAIIISIIQFGDLSQVPFIIMLLLVIYTLDNGFVQPYVFSKSLDIHPILIILLIIAGGQLFGLLGMMLIIPATTVIKTAVKEIYFALKNYRIARL